MALQDAYAQIDDLRRDYVDLQRRPRTRVLASEHVETAAPAQAYDDLGQNEMLAHLAQTLPQAQAYLRLRFNIQHYLRENPDLNGAVNDGELIDPFTHWVAFGWREGRSAAFLPDRLMADEALATTDRILMQRNKSA
jgi:hypothetical protein